MGGARSSASSAGWFATGANLMRGSLATASSFVRRGGLIRAGVAQDPKTPLLVGHVDVTARVDEDVLRLGHEVARQGAGALSRLRRNDPATFDGQQRVLDVVDAQP